MIARKTKNTAAPECSSEHAEQCALIKWWALECKRFRVPENLLFAIPNGGARNAVTGATLKAEGVRPGVPDLFLAFPVDCEFGGESFHFCGLFIEMKRKKGGRISDEQKQMLNDLRHRGYLVVVCYGFEEAKLAVSDYACGFCENFPLNTDTYLVCNGNASSKKLRYTGADFY